MATIKKPIKKAQNGVVAKDKTTTKKPNAIKIMKNDNEIAVRKEKNKAELANYNKNKNVSAALMYGDKEGTLLKSANKQDSLAKVANKKAITLKNNPRFKLKFGGSVKAKDGKWIQKAINPAHKGYCTPQTKATCTPKRKALAQTLRKISKKKK
jgi:hypothetical protein